MVERPQQEQWDGYLYQPSSCKTQEDKECRYSRFFV